MTTEALTKEARIEIGKELRLPNGVTVKAERRKKEKPVEKLHADETSIHEAKHAVVAWMNGTSVLYITVIPGRDKYGNEYLGMTLMSRYDAAAAAAPHAHGHGGTSGDRALMAQRGDDIDAHAGEAGGIMAESTAYIVAVANKLSEKGALGASAFEAIMQTIKANEDDEYEVVVTVTPPNGKVETRTEEDSKTDILTIHDIPVLIGKDIKTEADFQADLPKAT